MSKDNSKAVRRVKKELESLLIGREHQGVSCGCGEIHFGKSVVISIDPPRSYKALYFSWYMSFKTLDDDREWSSTLGLFDDDEAVKEIFLRHFGEEARI